MKTTEDLMTRAKELSKQAVELRRKGSEANETNQELAKQFRQQARAAMKHTLVLIQEIKSSQIQML